MNINNLYNKIAERLIRSIQLNFKAGGRPNKWTKRKDNKTHNILIKSGILKNSIFATVDQNVGKINIGTNVVYAAIHNFGGKAGRNHSATIPARPFMLVQQQDYKYINNLLQKFGDDLLQKSSDNRNRK